MTLTDTQLDALLNQYTVPDSASLSDEIFIRAMRERAPKLWLFFVKNCTWLSVAFLIGGFCFGSYANAADYQNAAAYLDTLYNYGAF